MIEIAVSIISAVATILAVVITTNESGRKQVAEISSKFEVAQAVTDEKIAELTREVREHNNFAKRMPVVEEQIKVINHRLEDIERKE